MTTLSLKLPPALEARLARTARSRGISKSRLVREAIEAHLSRVPEKGSCLDLAGDLAGSVRAAPDLSSNPKHMQGYGR